MNGIMKKLLLLLYVLMALVLTCPTPALAQTGTVVRVSPSLINLQPGDTATVEIWVDDVEALYGFAVEIHFDPAKLSAGSTALGDFLDEGWTAFDSVDIVNGIIQYDMVQVNPSEPKSGSGVLMTFTITLLESVSETNLTIDSILLTDRNGTEIPCGVENGVVRMYENAVFLPLVMR